MDFEILGIKFLSIEYVCLCLAITNIFLVIKQILQDNKIEKLENKLKGDKWFTCH